MRADRLLALLMLLQTRGRMTARQLAGELEVSERTVYRDMEALSLAGVPVYAERGPGGGCALLDDYRTNLTGLTESEVRALFMLSVPAPLAELGVSDELRAALLKLAAALPSARRPDEERARKRIHLDSVPWSQTEAPAPHLQTVYRAVWQDRKLHITYRLSHDAQAQRLVSPYGLVAKVNVWHLVFATDRAIQAVRVSDILEARLADDGFERPPDFDLAAFWEAWCAAWNENRPRYPVKVRVAPELIPLLSFYFGPLIQDIITQAGPPDAQGWVTLTLVFERLEAARDRLLGLGRAVEVLEPKPLRLSLIDFAAQIVALYGGAGR